MKILCDENIPLAQKLFAPYGELTLTDGRRINRAQVREQDALLLRSVTPVTEELLSGSCVRFIGSATIGCDHVDLDYLQQAGIAFAHAPGASAGAVAEYVLSALLVLAERQGFELREKTVGLVGYGHIGKRLKRFMDALNVNCLINDPPLQAAGELPEIAFASLQQVLQADIISLHVPLQRYGLYPSYHLIDTEALAAMRPGAILINTSRGAVIDTQALRQSACCYVLDVWEDEPYIAVDLVQHAAIATPHIAGHSYDAKIAGVAMVYHAFCKYFACAEHTEWLRIPDAGILSVIGSDQMMALRDVVWQCYDVRRDDSLLRAGINSTEPLAVHFDRLRRDYPLRRAFQAYRLHAPGQYAFLRDFGFICR